MGLVADQHDRRESGWKTPAFLGTLCAFFFTHLAMLLYRGGNPLTDERHYTFTRNFLSDLGLITTYNHQSQPLVVASFAVGMAAAAFAVAAWYKNVPSRAVQLGKVIATVGLLTLVLLPSDLFLWPHRAVVIASLMGLALANATLAWNQGKPHVSYHTILAIFQISYLFFIFFGPLPEENRELHVILQKIAIYTQLFLLLTPQKNYPER